MTASIAGTLTTEQVQQAQQQANVIAGSANTTISNNQFVFFAAFDGTNNDKNLLLTGVQSTNVGQISDQAIASAGLNQNLGVGYYPGPGTSDSLPGSSVTPAQEAINTANKAYTDFQLQASAWLEQNPGGSVTTALAAFSRGADAGAVFSQLLYERGLSDPKTGEILIPPGQVGVSAGIMLPPTEN